MKKILLVFVFALLFAVTQQSNAAITVYNNGSGTYAGRLWKFWQTGSDNGYLIVWTNGYRMHYSNASDVTGGVGWSNGAERTIHFSGLSINGGGHVLQSFYGWTKNPLVEYYIVENYGSVTPGSGTNMGTFSSDGGTYRIWKDTRVNAPSIIGTATFPQYKSVRTSRHSSGTVTSRNHFNKWRSLGMNLGPINSWTQLLHSEAMGGASGSATCGWVSNGGGGGSTSTTTTSGGGSCLMELRARSTDGQGKVRLIVGGKTCGDWTLGTSMSTKSVRLWSSRGNTRVEFYNDASGRDVQVDYLRVCGSTRQAESRGTNTAVWQNGSCGGSNSEWMHCNGYIDFGNTSY